MMRYVDETAEQTFRREWVKMIGEKAPPQTPKSIDFHGQVPRDLLCILLMGPVHGYYGKQLCDRTNGDQGAISRILNRWKKYDLVISTPEIGEPKKLGRGLRIYWTLTRSGREMAELCDAAGRE